MLHSRAALKRSFVGGGFGMLGGGVVSYASEPTYTFTSATSSTSSSYTVTLTSQAGQTIPLTMNGVSQGNMVESPAGTYSKAVTLNQLTNTFSVASTTFDVTFNAIVNPSFRGRFYNEGLTDISGNGVSVQNGSSAGADTNDVSSPLATFDGNDYIQLGSHAKNSFVFVFSPTTLQNSSSPVTSLISGESSDWHLSFGAATGLLTNEYLTLTVGAMRLGLTDGGNFSTIYHVVLMCWTGTSWKIYVNGIEKAVSVSGTQVEIPIEPVKLGSSGSGLSRFFSGRESEYIAWATDQSANAADIYTTLKLEHATGGITLP